jgi:hypothetical protein
LRVGVLDHELGAFQAFLVVDFRADQILVAHRIDEQLHAVFLHHGIVLVLHLVEGEAVLKARAAAAGDEYPQLEVAISSLTLLAALSLNTSGMGIPETAFKPSVTAFIV